MLNRFLLMLACRRFVGRVVAVSTTDSCPGMEVERVGFLGIEGRVADGDRYLILWSDVTGIHHGPWISGEFEKRRHKAALRNSCPDCSDSPRAGSFSATEIAAMLREPEGA